MGDDERREYVLGTEHELRLEAEPATGLAIELLSGTAEMYGTELVLSHSYRLPAGAKAAVCTWAPTARIAVKGRAAVAYISQETPMRSYVNTHAALHALRQQAHAERSRGPRVLIVGPEASGRASVAMILANYACRQHHFPVFINADPAKPLLSPPGSLSMAVLMLPANIASGFSDATPLMYHFGHLQPKKNLVLYHHIAAHMGQVLDNKLSNDDRARSSGCIVLAPVLPSGDLLKLRAHFSCDVVIVLDQERLLNEISQSLSNDKVEGVTVMKLPKSGGVVARDAGGRQLEMQSAVRHYFYGFPPEAPLSPFSFDVPIARLQLYKIGAPPTPASCLPLGVKPPEHETQLVKLSDVTPDMIHKLCAVVAIPENFVITEENSREVLRKQTLGYVAIQDRDTARKSVKLSSPAPHPLPSLTLLISDVSFADR